MGKSSWIQLQPCADVSNYLEIHSPSRQISPLRLIFLQRRFHAVLSLVPIFQVHSTAQVPILTQACDWKNEQVFSC